MRKLTVVLALAALALSAAPPRAATAGTAADRPVLLADAQAFEASDTAGIGQAEIAEARRELSAAVSSEKFAEGFAAAVAAGMLLCLVF